MKLRETRALVDACCISCAAMAAFLDAVYRHRRRCGCTGMLVDPSGKAMGMDAMLPYFQVLPFADVLFRDLTFSGIALLIVNGLTNLTAAGLILAKKPTGVVLGGVFGVTLMLWICIQFYMFPPNFMSTSYFLFGCCRAATGYAA